MNGGIYRIFNLTNGKSYVGQTVDFKRRKHEHFYDLKNGLHRNDHLQKSYNRYGKDSFRFEILQEVIVPDTVIKRIDYQRYLIPFEQYWIDKFDATSKHKGYNIGIVAGSITGFKHDPRTIETMIENQSKFCYRITRPDGSEEDIVNLRRFCRENNLSSSTMYKVLSGKQDQHRGFRVIGLESIGGTTKFDYHVSESTRRKIANSLSVNEYIVMLPNGEEVKISNLHKFCLENKLDSSSMYGVANGHSSKHRGYRVTRISKRS